MTLKASDLVALPIRLGSAVRHRRVFHPVGVLAQGRLDRTAPEGVGLPVASADVLGRLSKAFGRRAGRSDVIGLALEMPPRTPGGRPWDVLLASAGSGRLTRFVPRAASSWTGAPLSTLMSLRHDGGRWWLRAEIRTELGAGLSLDDVRAAVDGGGLLIDLSQSRDGEAFEPIARLTLDAVIPTDASHDVSFDPTRHSAPGVALGPKWLAALRARAYERSREGRDAPDPR